MAEKKEGHNFEEQVLAVIQDVPSRNDDGSGMRIRMIRWRVDGKVSQPKLEKRSYYQDQNGGGERSGKKAEGLTRADFGAIKENWAKVLQAFDNPGEFVSTRGSSASAAKAPDDIEDVPF